MKNKKTKSKIK